MLSITGLPAFNDNYIWMLADTKSRTCHVVDPGDASVVEAACREAGLTLAGILVTHHHVDHTGGIHRLASIMSVQQPIPVYGPANENIMGVTHPLQDGDTLSLYGTEWQVMETPGHTAGHISYFGEPPDLTPSLFCGDTLFAGGCGRLFEGTPAQMLTSLTRLGALPPHTRIYCAHEYTQANLEFAKAVEPGNHALSVRQQKVKNLRQKNLPTVPSLLEEELATNPFLRATTDSVQEAAGRRSGRPITSTEDTFTIIRQWKDNF